MDLDIFNYFLNQIFVLKAISYIYFCKKIEFFYINCIKIVFISKFCIIYIRYMFNVIISMNL